MTRIGLYGGAFDPPHLAHVALARSALVQFQLEQLRVIPTGSAWHKNRPLTAAHHRLAMAHLAFDDIHSVRVDPREMKRDGPTYTIDTLSDLKVEYPNAVFFLFVGQDQAQAFTTWHRWEAILDIATLVVAQRPGVGSVDSVLDTARWHNGGPAKVQSLDMSAMDVSATDIRSRIAQADLEPTSLPALVLRYIKQHRLYQTHTDDRNLS
ncbi:nicotinate (nicotinamide) nucleotide adenylyltransferase [Limnohabitans sp.]|uniref:nicotinate (nicotinamide) nucleotide adenylyltransferase n=1 Tax=Limnohabitans sp. TaxID=1907725 RepID=UPI0038B7E352